MFFYPRPESMRERGRIRASGEGHAIRVLLQMATSSADLHGQLHLHVLGGRSSTGVLAVPRLARCAVLEGARPNSPCQAASPCGLEVVFISETFLGIRCSGPESCLTCLLPHCTLWAGGCTPRKPPDERESEHANSVLGRLSSLFPAPEDSTPHVVVTGLIRHRFRREA